MMIEGYEIVEVLSDNLSLIKDSSGNSCYGIFENSSNTIVGYKFYKIKKLSKGFLLGKEKGPDRYLLSYTGAVVDHVCYGKYEFIGRFMGLSFFYKKVKGGNKTILILETYRDRVSGELFTYKANLLIDEEVLSFNNIEVYPPANRSTEAFKSRQNIIKGKAFKRLSRIFNHF